jgi:hypothetical protein
VDGKIVFFANVENGHIVGIRLLRAAIISKRSGFSSRPFTKCAADGPASTA